MADGKKTNGSRSVIASLHVLTGLHSSSQGVHCVNTLVVANSLSGRIQAGMLGANEEELWRHGCEKRGRRGRYRLGPLIEWPGGYRALPLLGRTSATTRQVLA